MRTERDSALPSIDPATSDALSLACEPISGRAALDPSDRVVLAQSDPQAQIALIHSATVLYDDCFPFIKSAEGQIAALSKLTLDFDFAAGKPFTMKEFLLKSALDGNVVMAIQDMRFGGSSAIEADYAISGDPARGLIHYLRQIHTVYLEDRPELREIGRIQANILSYLRRENLRDVFVESQWQSFTSTEVRGNAGAYYHYWLMPADLRAGKTVETLVPFLQNLFTPFPADDDYSPDQLLYLGALGAGFIHALTSEDVTLHQTISGEEDSTLAALILKQMETIGDTHSLLFDRREEIALRRIDEHLLTHPGGRVALIFGRAHDFAPDAQALWSDPPVLINLDQPASWRTLGRWQEWNLPDGISLTIQYLRDFPAQQDRMIEMASTIRPWALESIVSESAQIRALAKIAITCTDEGNQMLASPTLTPAAAAIIRERMAALPIY